MRMIKERSISKKIFFKGNYYWSQDNNISNNYSLKINKKDSYLMRITIIT